MDKAQAIRVTIVGSADRQLQEMLRGAGWALQFQGLDALVSFSNPSAVVPNAVVVDLREQETVPSTLALLKRHHPQVGVVIVATQLDPALMLDAMRAGLTEWVAEPVTAASIQVAVDRVTQQRLSQAPTGKVFAFLGAKGGVGTTTTAVNVATALRAQSRGRTLLIDLHLAHGDAALFLGVEPKFTFTDALDNIHRLDGAFLRSLVTSTKSGVDLLASSERSIVAVPDAQRVREVLTLAAQHYDHVVLDVPRSDITMLDALEITSSVIVIANQELATLRRAAPLVLALRQRYGRERVSLVMSRFDQKSEIQREDVERVTGGAIRHIIPSDYRLALNSLNKGQPLVVENHNRLAASFVSLAASLAGLEEKPKSTTKSSGLLSRLGMRS